MPSPQKSTAARRARPKGSPSTDIAVLSDIHSNLHALQAVLDDCAARKITNFICLGDIVGYGAFPRECLKLIRSLRCPTVVGNHDFYVGNGAHDENLNELARRGIEYSKKQLTSAARKWLLELPEVITAQTFTLVHSSLEEPLDWTYICDAAEARPSLVRLETPVCFFGHTHVPKLFVGGQPVPTCIGGRKYQLHFDGHALINFGSVGQPRNEDPRAQFGIFDPQNFTVEFAAVEYDARAAAEAVLDAGLPEPLAARLLVGL